MPVVVDEEKFVVALFTNHFFHLSRPLGLMLRFDAARGGMKKSRYVKVIERKDIGGDDPIECFLPVGVGSTS